MGKTFHQDLYTDPDVNLDEVIPDVEPEGDALAEDTRSSWERQVDAAIRMEERRQARDWKWRQRDLG